MTRFLLDANVLIALVVAEHEHHEGASRWFADVDVFLVCPIVEGALVRTLLRLGESGHTAQRLLCGVRADARCTFVADSMSYRELDLGGLVTFDRALAGQNQSSPLLLGVTSG